MKIVLSGAEKGTYRNALMEQNVPAVALNLTQFSIPKTKEVVLSDLLQGADIWLYTSDDDEDVARFDEFIRTHADDLSGVIGRPDYNGDWLGDKYVPLWNDVNDLERLAYLCEKYGRVAVSDRALTPKTLPRIRQLQQRWGVTLVGITSKVDTISSLPWDVAIVSSWTSVVRWGETQVWDGHGLRRYPAQKKDSARKKHRADIVRLGCDYEQVVEGDVKELSRLAIKSWLAWEENTYGPPSNAAYQAFGEDDDDEAELLPNGEIVAISPETTTSPIPSSEGESIAIAPPNSRNESERKLLPVLGLGQVESHTHSDEEGENSDDSPRTESVVTYSAGSVRNCDSCYLAPRCTAFKEHAECAYGIPVEVRTKSQLRAVMNALITMQSSRIMFAAFGEELEGQGIDPTLSAEMDRWFRMVKDMKDIEDTRDLIRIDVEAKASSGVLSRIFGSGTQEKVAQVSTPMTAGELDQAIIDAEVLE